MCVVSMIMDSQYDNWFRRYQQPYHPYQPYQYQPYQPDHPFPLPTYVPNAMPGQVPMSGQIPPTQLEIEEFRRLLDRAREYDRKNNEPDCELEEKRQKLKKLAAALGVAIDFV